MTSADAEAGTVDTNQLPADEMPSTTRRRRDSIRVLLYRLAQRRIVRRTRFQALYVQLPFELAAAVAEYPRLEVAPQEGSKYKNFHPVHLRFHAVQDVSRLADDRALNIAMARAPSTLAEQNRVRLLPKLQARVDKATRTRVSVAELETAFPRHLPGKFSPATSQQLTDHSLEALNRFLDVYQVLTEQSSVHHLNPDNLGPELVLEFRRLSDVPTGRLTLPHRQGRTSGEGSPPDEHLLSLINNALRREPHKHPLDLVRRLYLRAGRFADMGEYEAAIESLQTSAERLVFALHTLVLAEQGHSSNVLESLLPATFSAALKKMPSLLGGNWSTSGNGAVALYWSGLYMVRNRVTHVGVTPDRDSVPDAFDAYSALWVHALDRTMARRAAYPRTALAVHGGIGLRKAGALDKAMRTFIAGVEAAGEGDTFWLPADQR